MNIVFLRNAIEKKDISKTLKFLRKFTSDTSFLFKVSPNDYLSSFLRKISFNVDRGYSFSSLRCILYLKSNTSIDLLDIVKRVYDIDENSYKVDFYKALRPNKVFYNTEWGSVYIEGLPSLVVGTEYYKGLYTYIIGIPGTPDRPLWETPSSKHPTYYFTMNFPHYEDSFDIAKDDVIFRLYQNLKKYYNISIYNNILELDVNRANIFSMNKYMRKYNGNPKQLPRIEAPTIYNLHIKKDIEFGIFYNQRKNKVFYKRFWVFKKPIMTSNIHKNSLLKMIYTSKACAIDSIDKCHLLASNLNSYFNNIFSISSYYQKAFDFSKEDLFSEKDLSYGHNTFLERASVGKSSIHLYYKNTMYIIHIYSNGLFIIIGDENEEIPIEQNGNTKLTGGEVISKLQSYLLYNI